MNAAGGIQRAAANLVRDLRTEFDTLVVTVYAPQDTVFRESEQVLKSLNLPYVHGKFYPRLWEALVIGWRLRRLVADENIDTVICIWYHVAVIAALALPRSVKKIGYEHIAFAAATGIWARLRWWSYRRLDAVVSLTKEDHAQFAAISKRALVIPNYVPLPASRDPGKREKLLLAVGHIEYRKGLDRLLWALKEPLQANPDWKLVFVGGGDIGHSQQWYVAYLHALTRMLHLANRVELCAATHRIEEWYRRASIYVMGSRLEGLPMVLLEAKSHGLPVVSYDCPTGPKEIVRHGVDGFLIPNDLTAFAAAARALMDDDDLRQRMGEAAIEDIRLRFVASRICPQWRDLIAAVHGEPAFG
jgi:glycosyltransferase involved in cell wall biosynthesis